MCEKNEIGKNKVEIKREREKNVWNTEKTNQRRKGGTQSLERIKTKSQVEERKEYQSHLAQKKKPTQND